MRDLIKKHWKLLLFVIIVATLTLLYLLLKSPSQTATPSVTPIPSPTPIPFELINTFPPPGDNNIVLSNLALQFAFSKPIDIDTAIVIVEPFIFIDKSTDIKGSTLILHPEEDWVFDTTYNLTIEVKSEEGEDLPEEIEYSFTPQSITESDLIEGPRNF